MTLTSFINGTDVMYTTQEQNTGPISGNIQCLLNPNKYCSTTPIPSVLDGCSVNPFSNNIIRTSGSQNNPLSGIQEDIPTEFNSITPRHFGDSGSFAKWSTIQNNNIGSVLTNSSQRGLTWTKSSSEPINPIESSPPLKITNINNNNYVNFSNYTSMGLSEPINNINPSVLQ